MDAACGDKKIDDKGDAQPADGDAPVDGDKQASVQDMVDGSECRPLNRVVRCTPAGREVEPDQRHADMLVQDLELKTANGVTTPGEHEARG